MNTRSLMSIGALSLEGEIRPDFELEAALDLLSGVCYYQVVARGESLSNLNTLLRRQAAMDIIWLGIARGADTGV